MKFLVTWSLFFTVFSNFFPSTAYSQKDTARITVTAEVIGTDTLPLMLIKPYDVIEKPDPEAIKKLNEMNRLFVNVSKVLPYARAAKTMLDEIKTTIATMNTKREKKEYIKAKEKELKEQFTADLKNLTVTQGRILIKLIDRETGETSYELVKELRGTLAATVWQGIAQVFGEDLKTNYDTLGEDKAVEQIIRRIDSTGFKPLLIKSKAKQ